MSDDIICGDEWWLARPGITKYWSGVHLPRRGETPGGIRLAVGVNKGHETAPTVPATKACKVNLTAV